MATVYLVSCVSKKKTGRLPARDMYDSAWFKKARAYVERRQGRWFILSAEHGLLDPGTLIRPYDQTLNLMRISERREWARSVLSDLRGVLEPDDHVVVLAGAKYTEFLLERLRATCEHVDIPMRGMRIGEQLQWLSRQR